MNFLVYINENQHEPVTAAKMKVTENGDLLFWNEKGQPTAYATGHWTKVWVEPVDPPDLSKMTADEIAALSPEELERARAAEKEKSGQE